MLSVDCDVEPTGEDTQEYLHSHRRVQRVLSLAETILAQWAAYDADRAQPPARRAGVACPRVLRESCLALRERFLAELSRLEAEFASYSSGRARLPSF